MAKDDGSFTPYQRKQLKTVYRQSFHLQHSVFSYNDQFMTGASTISISKFSVDIATGEVRTTDYLDADVPITHYELVVKAYNDVTPETSATATFTLTIDDVNEFDPVFAEVVQV